MLRRGSATTGFVCRFFSVRPEPVEGDGDNPTPSFKVDAVLPPWIFKDLEAKNDFNESGKTEQGLLVSSAWSGTPLI